MSAPGDRDVRALPAGYPAQDEDGQDAELCDPIFEAAVAYIEAAIDKLAAELSELDDDTPSTREAEIEAEPYTNEYDIQNHIPYFDYDIDP